MRKATGSGWGPARCRLLSLTTALAFLLGGPSPSEARPCFTFMGVSTCELDGAELDAAMLGDEYTFSIPWWFANVHANIDVVNQLHGFLHETPVGRFLEKSPHVAEVWKLLQTDIFGRFTEAVVSRLRRSGEPVDMLTNKDLDPVVLIKSGRKHHREIINFIDDMLKDTENNRLDDDIRDFAEKYSKHLKVDSPMLSYGPDPTEQALFKLLTQDFLAKIRKDRLKKAEAGVA